MNRGIISIVICGLFATCSATAHETLLTEEQCKSRINGILEILLSGSVLDGNNALASFEYLLARLDSMALKRMAAEDATQSQKRALLWGRMRLSPSQSAEWLYQLIDAPLTEDFDPDSSDLLGNAYPGVAQVRTMGPSGLLRLTRASSLATYDKHRTRQAYVIAALICEEFRNDIPMIEAYLDRFHPGDSATRVKEIALKIARKEDVGIRSLEARQGLPSLVIRANSVKISEFSSNPFCTAKSEGNAEIDRLAEAIVSHTEVDGRGGLGLFSWTISRSECVLRDELQRALLPSAPAAAQGQGVQRCLIVLGMMNSQHIVQFLVDHPSEEIRLDNPGRTEPFRIYPIARLCSGAGDSVIGPIIQRVSLSSDGVSDAILRDYASVALKACGPSAADYRFLALRIVRAQSQSPSSKALARFSKTVNDIRDSTK